MALVQDRPDHGSVTGDLMSIIGHGIDLVEIDRIEKMRAEHPERMLEIAVKGMLPKNPLGRAMFRKLKVYAGPEHPHTAQQPQVLEF